MPRAIALCIRLGGAMSTSREMFWIVLFAALSSASFACDNPPLAPAVPDPGGLSQEQRQAVQQEVGAYYEAVKVYTACLEAEIATARGDDAPRYRSELLFATMLQSPKL